MDEKSRHFRFLQPGTLVDEDLQLLIIETGHRGPENDLFPFYRFAMINTHTRERMGRITLRIGDVSGVLRYAGHIGFDVIPEHRGHRYAARATYLVMSLARAHGLKALWIGCSEDNIASRKTCERLGGMLVETIDVPSGIDLYAQGMRKLCRYCIHLQAQGPESIG